MDKIEILPISVQGGYGYKTGQVDQNGAKQDVKANGATLSAEGSLGFGVKTEADSADTEAKRVKAGITFFSAKADALTGSAHDNYLRMTLNYGFRYYADLQTEVVRIIYASGLTGRFDYTNMKLADQTLTGQTNSITIPLAFGLGVQGVMISDKCEFGIGFSPTSFRLQNQAEVGYRLYANYNNTFFESIDLFANHTLAMGQLSDTAKETSHLFAGGIRIGLFNPSPKLKEPAE